MTHNNQSPIRFLFLKLPPPPCAVLLVSADVCICWGGYKLRLKGVGIYSEKLGTLGNMGTLPETNSKFAPEN